MSNLNKKNKNYKKVIKILSYVLLATFLLLRIYVKAKFEAGLNEYKKVYNEELERTEVFFDDNYYYFFGFSAGVSKDKQIGYINQSGSEIYELVDYDSKDWIIETPTGIMNNSMLLISTEVTEIPRSYLKINSENRNNNKINIKQIKPAKFCWFYLFYIYFSS